ncbi:MAG: PAP/fibrillin family protein [Congregibacter sp.]
MSAEVQLGKDLEAMKFRVRHLIDAADSEGQYSDAQFDELMSAIKELAEMTPLPDPLDHQDKVASPWRTLFASFGPRHTAGKSLEHDTLMSFQSFNKFPKLPIRVTGLEQEIHAQTKEYNNIAYIRNPSGDAEAMLITRGEYADGSENRQRYEVTFRKVELLSSDGRDEHALREAFGLESDYPLSFEFAGKFHSDVAYCDDELRINFGSVGGSYVLERLHHSGRSVSFK